MCVEGLAKPTSETDVSHECTHVQVTTRLARPTLKGMVKDVTVVSTGEIRFRDSTYYHFITSDE
jgi:hypothetical protein